MSKQRKGSGSGTSSKYEKLAPNDKCLIDRDYWFLKDMEKLDAPVDPGSQAEFRERSANSETIKALREAHKERNRNRKRDGKPQEKPCEYIGPAPRQRGSNIVI